ncbi:type IX secretion system membrane protein PorP/SprF [bacterium]|nr:type IX secretion system membrane protein PorP/SprF [bacterium]
MNRGNGFYIVILLLFSFVAISEQVDIDSSDSGFFPYENNILLDGMPANGIGSFAMPQRPALLNPAGLASVPQTQVACDFQRYFWGIGDNLSSGNILFVHHVLNRGFGAGIGIFNGGMVSTQSYSLHYAQRLGRARNPFIETNRIGLFGGVTARFRRRAYSENDFHLGDSGDPLFIDGYSSTAFSFGFGFVYRKPSYSLQFSCDDLNRPNFALEAGEKDRLPMELQVGGEFFLPWEGIRIAPSLNYRSEYGDFASDIDPNIAVRRDFMDGKLELGFFAGRWAFGLGANYYLDLNTGPGARYEISQPLTGIGVPSHRVSASYRFQPPPPAYPDLTVKNIEIEGNPIIDASLIARIEVRNKGIRNAEDVRVSLFSDGRQYKTQQIQTIKPDENGIIEFELIREVSGEFELLARADDSGNSYSQIDGHILELDETNNELKKRFFIYDRPKASLDIDLELLRLTQEIIITEDEPVIPIVFFEAESAAVAERFDNLISNVAERMVDNPDAVLYLSGYYSTDDPQGEQGQILSSERARNVAHAIIEVEPELADRIEISTEHRRSHARAEKEKFEGTRLGKKYTAEENRRVEMSVQPGEPNEWFLKSYALNSLDMEELQKRLYENPLFEIVAIAPTLDSAYAIERELAKLVGQRFAGRVYSREDKDENPKIIITASGILYKPRAFEIPDEELKIEPGYGESKFNIETEGGGKIVGSRLIIENSSGKTYREFSDKKGLLKTVTWDWTIPGDGLVDPSDCYIAYAKIVDEFDQESVTKPETLTVELTNSRDISGRLILVQFAFAGAFGEPDYASVRMEQLTREIVGKVQRDGWLDVVIGGHTDVVGVETGNLKLSQRRAEEQFLTFKEYIMKILNMDTEGQLESWLAENNSTMSARGYGSSRSYAITRGKGSDSYKIIHGNNDLPEGRIINRRVEVEFTPRIE